jgi:hypothetical protein
VKAGGSFGAVGLTAGAMEVLLFFCYFRGTVACAQNGTILDYIPDGVRARRIAEG